MFRSLRYCNVEKIHQYYSIITRQKRLNIQNINVSNEKGANIGFSAIGADMRGSTTIDATMEEDLHLDYDIFEESLMGRDDYFDTTQESYDLSTVLNGSIIKFQSYMEIPEEFDIIQLLEQFKPMLLGQASLSMETDAYNFLEKSIEKDDVKIPCIFELADVTCYSQINSSFLLTTYENLEEFENEEVTVLAKVISHKNGKTAIFNPLKDFIKVNRAMRRSADMSKFPKELVTIEIDGILISLEILAIYQ